MIGMLAELTVSVVSLYNISRGVYNMYSDAKQIGKTYKTYRKTTEQYRATQKESLTESQLISCEGEFVVMDDYDQKMLDSNNGNSKDRDSFEQLQDYIYDR